jgi:Phycobilisome degradation protein nblA
MLASFSLGTKEMTKEQLELELTNLFKLMLIKENMYKQIILESAGIL